MKRICLLTLLFFVGSLFAAPTATVKVTRAEYGDKWPFSVSEGTIGYEALGPKLAILTFSAAGKTYALNGIAKGLAKKNGYRAIEEIWKPNPAIPGTKIDVSPIIQRGLALGEK